MKAIKMTKWLALGVCVFGLTACGKSSNSTENSKNEITFWNPFTGADSSNMGAMIDAYNQTDPEYKIKNVSLKESDMYAKIPTVVNSGKNIPDLMIVHAERIKQYHDNNMLEDYDALLENHPTIIGENYVEEAWKLGELDGKRYSIPLDIHSWGTYYNKELVEKYAPDSLADEILTFDEIKEAGKKAAADDIRGVAVTWVKPNFLSLLKQYGGGLTENGTDPTLDTKATKDAIGLWNELYEEGVTTKDGEDPTQLFLSGKLLFFPEGTWVQNNIKDAKFEWGLTNSPQLSDDLNQAVNWASSHQFVRFNSTERTEEKDKGIMEFLEWIRNNSLEWAKAGQNPATLNILEDEEYQKLPHSLFISTPEQQQTLNIFDYKYNGYVAEYLDAQGFDTIFGKQKVDDFSSGMQKEVADKIAKDSSNK